VSQKLAEVEDRDGLLKNLQYARDEAAVAYKKAAGAMSAERLAAAGKLAKLAETQINSLAMKVKFEIDVAVREQETHWTANGWDDVEYRIATNAGEPLKPLDEIASGGEMSRVMLALKVTVEENFATGVGRAKRPRKAAPSLPTPRMLVFDEIDIGIGGRAAEAVGRKLKTLSKRQQVVCITHLPQIAAFADQHFLIEKSDEGGRTFTRVRRLEASERESEIARMLSGAKLTEASVENARQLIESSR
jgi:DNA repair protein RecN (Recombination protein N)